eukprot:scaffold386602_cov45-Prasinocladus_malaysianus.AAC.1
MQPIGPYFVAGIGQGIASAARVAASLQRCGMDVHLVLIAGSGETEFTSEVTHLRKGLFELAELAKHLGADHDLVVDIRNSRLAHVRNLQNRLATRAPPLANGSDWEQAVAALLDSDRRPVHA